jgi:hypothetical protein
MPLPRRPVSLFPALAATLLLWPSAAAQDLCVTQAAGLPHPASVLGGDGVELLANALVGGGQQQVSRYGPGGWEVLPGVFQGTLRSLASSSGGPLVGGTFTAIDGAPVARVARFDGQQWQALGTGIGGPGAVVRAVVEHQGEIYAGGSFSSAGGVPCANIARFDGQQWHPLGAGIDGEVRDLVSFQGQLIVAGSFASADGLPAANVVAFDGSNFAALGGVALPQVHDLAATAERLLAAADSVYSYQGGPPPTGQWQVLGSPIVDGVNAQVVAFAGGRAFAAGPLQGFCLTFGGDLCLAVADLDQGVWDTLLLDDSTPNLAELSFAVAGQALFFSGGTFGTQVIDTVPVVQSVVQSFVPWYGASQLDLYLGCLVPGAPATLRIGNGAPLPVVFSGALQGLVSIPSGYLQETGELDLHFEQAGHEQLLEDELQVRPVLSTSLGATFVQYVFQGFVHAAQPSGTAWLLAGTPAAAPLSLPGLGGQLVLDLGAGPLVLATGQLTAAPSVFQPTFGFGYPLGALPPGTTIPLQAVVLEFAFGGPYVAFTNGVVAALTF